MRPTQLSRKPSQPSQASESTPIHLRAGEVVVYRRSRSLLYQCRHELAEGSWHRQSPGKASVEHAIARACDICDEARHRQRLGLAHRTHLLAHTAAQTLEFPPFFDGGQPRCLQRHFDAAAPARRVLLAQQRL